MGTAVKITAILATYNEERFIAPCIEHHRAQGVSIYLCDNQSTDTTVAIAERYRGRGIEGIETIPRHGKYTWRPILERKEQLALELDADWFIHLDADEFFLAPPGMGTLAEALAAIDRRGYTTANALEYTFIPTREEPDHDHADFQATMRWYYPFAAFLPHRVVLWKKQPVRANLADSGGHVVTFAGARMYPEYFRMKHYLFLSEAQAIRKFVGRKYDEHEVAGGWHGFRPRLRPEDITLPSRQELRRYDADDTLDGSRPRSRHCLPGTDPAARERRIRPSE